MKGAAEAVGRELARPDRESVPSPGLRRDLAAWAGMALGGAVDFARLGPLGFVEICGDSNAQLLARIDAHAFSYAGMVAAFALAVITEVRARAGRAVAWRAAVQALAMCAGMAVADLVAPRLPGPLTPGLSLLLMTIGMACGTLVAHGLAGSAARPQDAGSRPMRRQQ